jgi:hypothetical protein
MRWFITHISTAAIIAKKGFIPNTDQTKMAISFLARKLTTDGNGIIDCIRKIEDTPLAISKRDTLKSKKKSTRIYCPQ